MGYLGIVMMKQEFRSKLLASEIFHKMEGFLAKVFFFFFFNKGKDFGSQEHYEVEGNT